MASWTDVGDFAVAAGDFAVAAGGLYVAWSARQVASDAVKVAQSTDHHLGELAMVARRASAPQITVAPLSVKMLHVVGLAELRDVAAFKITHDGLRPVNEVRIELWDKKLDILHVFDEEPHDEITVSRQGMLDNDGAITVLKPGETVWVVSEYELRGRKVSDMRFTLSWNRSNGHRIVLSHDGKVTALNGNNPDPMC